MNARPIVFLDVETDDLNAMYRRAWEFASIRREVDGTETRTRLFIRLGDVSKSDPKALDISGYWDRSPERNHTLREKPGGTVHSPDTAAKIIRQITHGATLVGANTSFDAATLERLLYANGLCPTWHFRLVCVESMTAGSLGLPFPLGLRECADELGISYVGLQAHTAMGDAILAMRIYDDLTAPEDDDVVFDERVALQVEAGPVSFGPNGFAVSA